MNNIFGYDLDTFSGRFKHFLRVVNPINSFNKENTLLDYQKKVESLKMGDLTKLSSSEKSELRNMETVLASSINPSSGTPIPWPMRTSAFVPTNIPIICGMLLTAPTPFNTFLW